MASSTISFVVSVALEIALFVVAITVVRKHRRDVWGWFGVVAGMQFLNTLIGLFGYAFVPLVVSRSSGVEAMLMVNAVVSLAHTLISAATAILLLTGIVQLARPPSAPLGGPFSNLGA